MTFYSQRDPRWAGVIYSAEPPHNETIKSAGCGIACAASVVTSLSDTVVEPPKMAEWSVRHGYRIDGVGTANALFPAVCKEYDLSFRETHSVSEAVECTKSGGLVVCGTSGKPKKLFSTGGHFFLLVGADGDRLQFFDPDCYTGKYTSYGREKYAVVKSGFIYVRSADADPEINQYYLICGSKKEEERSEEEVAETIYRYTIDVPDWGRPTIQKLLDKGYYYGRAADDLNLTESMLRIFVVMDRAGAFDRV